MPSHISGLPGHYEKIQHRPKKGGSHSNSKVPFPSEVSVKARLAEQRQRFSGYTDGEMRSVLVRLGYKHPEKLKTRLELMDAMDEVTSVVQK